MSRYDNARDLEEHEVTFFQDIIKVHGDINQLDEADQRILGIFISQAIKISKEFSYRFWQILEEYSGLHPGRISDKIQQFVKDKKFDFPRFHFYLNDQRFGALEKVGFGNYQLKDQSIVMIFEYPKPASWWWKKRANWYQNLVNEQDRYKVPQIEGQSIEWGEFYEQARDVFWDFFDIPRGVNKWPRINDIGDHQPLEYYYIFEFYSLAKYPQPLYDQNDDEDEDREILDETLTPIQTNDLQRGNLVFSDDGNVEIEKAHPNSFGLAVRRGLRGEINWLPELEEEDI